LIGKQHVKEKKQTKKKKRKRKEKVIDGKQDRYTKCTLLLKEFL